MTKFNHAIDDSFIDKLKDEAEKGGWWADVLADPGLLVALRGTYLNVYWRGQSLFYVEPSASRLKVTTHEKFLIDPGLTSQVQLTDGDFQVARLIEKGFMRKYQGKTTLAKMKKAASYFSGEEKSGCHEVAINNHAVIDCEVAFPGFVLSNDGTENEKGRVDLASLEQSENGIRLFFWEAKHYSNGDLRADLRYNEKSAPVCAQLKKYQNYLSEHWDILLDNYTKVCRNLVSLQGMGAKRTLSPLIKSVADGKPLILDEGPKVGLLIFGFNEAERDHAKWNKHFDRLRSNIFPSPIKAWGKAKDVKL